jgi:peptidoglycan hydrolase CwlO-like protein
LSTLTKILVVLLAISSIFLCGIVATYVGNSANYKQMYDDEHSKYQSAKQRENSAIDESKTTKAEADKQKEELNTQIADLKSQIEKSNTELTSAKLALDAANQRVNNWASITNNYSQTNEQQAQLLKDTITEMTTAKTNLTETQSRLDETTTALIEKNAIIAQLQADSKRLLEEKTSLQNRLDRSLQASNTTISTPMSVTPSSDKAQLAAPVVPLNLKGKISARDLKNSTVEISIGATDGVRKNMRFHIIREKDNSFVADLVIFEVGQDKAAGTLEIVQKTPELGDTVSTNI